MKQRSLLVSIAFLLVMTTAKSQDTTEVPAPMPKLPAAERAARSAIAAFREGRPYAAVEMARPLAAGGDADALFLLGFATESSKPARPTDLDARAYYYKEAVAKGNPEAGTRHLLTLLAGKSKERQNAKQTLEEAAERGDHGGARVLGEAWLRGFMDGKTNPAKAREYWSRAAKDGDAEAYLLLARLRQGAFGFPEETNPAESIGFFREAAKLGNQDAWVPLGSLLLKSPPSPENEREARGWLSQAIGKNIQAAYLVLGDYERDTKNDRKAAIARYREGSEAGQTDCMLRLATDYLSSGDEGSRREGRSWLKKAADAGSPAAGVELGRRYLEEGNSAAIPYLISASNEGLPQAQYELGRAYLEGKVLSRDPVAAHAWFALAAKSRLPEMVFQLATLQEEGIGCPVNYSNAGVLYTTAMRSGSGPAASRIAHMAAAGLGTDPNPVQAWAHAALAVELGHEPSVNFINNLDKELDGTARSQAKEVLAKLRASFTAKSAAPASPEKKFGIGDY